MILLFVSPTKDHTPEILIEDLGRLVREDDFAVFDSLDKLLEFMSGNPGDSDIVVLQAGSLNDLIDFQRLKQFRYDKQIILVSPDREQQTLFLAHQLHPRYVTSADDNLDDLVLVIKKMLRRKKAH